MEEDISKMLKIAQESLELQKEMIKIAKETNKTIRQMNVYLDKIPSV